VTTTNAPTANAYNYRLDVRVGPQTFAWVTTDDVSTTMTLPAGLGDTMQISGEAQLGSSRPDSTVLRVARGVATNATSASLDFAGIPNMAAPTVVAGSPPAIQWQADGALAGASGAIAWASCASGSNGASWLFVVPPNVTRVAPPPIPPEASFFPNAATCTVRGVALEAADDAASYAAFRRLAQPSSPFATPPRPLAVGTTRRIASYSL